MAKLVCCFTICFLCVQICAQEISRTEAIRISISEIIVPATLDHQITAYMTRLPLQFGDVISNFVGGQNYHVEKPTWFVWINDHPNAFFAHPTRFVFIDLESGEVTIETSEWWPELNGESLFMSREERKDLDLIIYSDLHRSSIPEN